MTAGSSTRTGNYYDSWTVHAPLMTTGSYHIDNSLTITKMAGEIELLRLQDQEGFV